MYLYKTAYEYGEAEYVVEKSRFIAHVQPAQSYEEAQAFVAKIKEDYKDATHNVPAIICGSKQEMQWASDDGEPSGTSGLPMLKMISEQDITNVAVVVTRYFGGIKLGTGGLARAYTTAAKVGLEAAGICEIHESLQFDYEFDYSYLAKLQNISREGRFEIVKTEYSDRVNATLECLVDNKEYLENIMTDLTAGKALLIGTKKTLKRLKI